jgi:AcrR family transcriptional regulator
MGLDKTVTSKRRLRRRGVAVRPSRARGTAPLRANGAVAPKPAVGRRRIRLDPEARTAMILEAAVAYFAEHGFAAQVSELSQRLGVSQGLIFRYFGTKQNLLERVYERVYVTRWSDDWEQLLRDRSRPLKDRLIDFYRSYLAAVDQYEWIRVSLFSGLAGYDLTHRYVMTRVEGLLTIIMAELRRLGPPGALPAKPDALREVVWHLHSTFIYYLIRKHVFGIPVIEDRDRFVDAVLDRFMAGLGPDQRRNAPRAER